VNHPHILLRESPPSDPDGQLQWAIEVMSYAWLVGNKALDQGAIYHPSNDGATPVLMRFLKRVEANTITEKEAAE
jgi:hypothetical protein